jgi:lipid A oxidase
LGLILRNFHFSWAVLFAAVSAAVFVAPGVAKAEFLLGIYGGISDTLDSDVDLEAPGGTDLTLEDVPFDGDSFENPIYYGVRGTYWLNGAPSYGVMLDFTHAKAIADEGNMVDVSGTRLGVPVAPKEAVGDTFEELQFSHGLNTLTLNGLYRHPLSWVTPYAGVGVGVSVPHVEVDLVGGSSTEEYQFGGVAAQALAGMEFSLGDRFALFAEYKFSYTPLDVDLDGGGSLETDLFTNQAMLGLSVRFGGGAPAK